MYEFIDIMQKITSSVVNFVFMIIAFMERENDEEN
jgi:hypothetical protein